MQVNTPEEKFYIHLRIHQDTTQEHDKVPSQFLCFIKDLLQPDPFYVLCKEEEGARPHYHAVFEKPGMLSYYKIKQIFKNNFPSHMGNKGFGFKTNLIPEDEVDKTLNYACKEGNFIHFHGFTYQTLTKHKSQWITQTGQIAMEKKSEALKNKDKALGDLQKFKRQLKQDIASPAPFKIKKEQYYKDFPEYLKKFIISNNIFSYNKIFVEKYYRNYLFIVDPNAYQDYVLQTIKSIFL